MVISVTVTVNLNHTEFSAVAELLVIFLFLEHAYVK